MPSGTDIDDGLAMPRRMWAVISISCGSVLYTLDGTIANVALPAIGDALHIAPSTAVLLVSVYNLVLAMLLLPFAAFGERFGHARVFRYGFIGYLVASLGCLLAGTFPILLLCRAAQAVAAASLLSVSLAMVRIAYPARMLGRGLGLNTMMASLGAALAPPIGGLLIACAPWSSVFGAGVPLALTGLLTSRSLPRAPLVSRDYDRRGALLCAGTFGLLIAGLQSLSQHAPVTIFGPMILAGGVLGLVFVRHERGVDAPVLPVDLLTRPALALSIAGTLFGVLASTALLLFLPFRLHGLGFGSAAIGALIAPYAIAVMIIAPSSGMLSDKVSPVLLGSTGMALATVGLLGIANLPAAPGYGDIAWRVAVCGAGFSLFFSPNGRMVVGSVPRDRAAGASSLVATTRMFAQALASTAMGGLLAMKLSPDAPAVIAAGIAGVGLACSVARIFVSAGAPGR
ncbi:MAG: MFS transporter [Sphingomonadales bacterium]|nr:MFS transporter [Sphingomonadales bacterium]